MLVLGRKLDQKVRIQCGGDVTTITVSRIKGNQVSLTFEAPQAVRIVRDELVVDSATVPLQTHLDPQQERLNPCIVPG